MQAIQEVVKLLNVVSADVQCVSGAVSKSHNQQDEVFTDGSVRYINPKLLRPFAKARQAATRLCRINGTRFLSGWAIPDESLDEVTKGLAKITAEVAQERAALIAMLPTHRAEWERLHPEVTTYTSKFPSNTSIAGNIQMLVSVFKITPMHMKNAELNDGIAAEVGSLAGRVLSEISQDVRDSWSPDAKEATTRARGVLERIHTKLDRMSFLSEDLAEVASMVDAVLQIIPGSGPIRGADFIILSGLMSTLCNPDSVVRTSRVVASQTPQNHWVGFSASQEEDPAQAALVAPEEVPVQAAIVVGEEEPVQAGLLDGNAPQQLQMTEPEEAAALPTAPAEATAVPIKARKAATTSPRKNIARKPVVYTAPRSQEASAAAFAW